MDGTIDMDSATLKLLLVTASYTPNPDHTFVDVGGANDVIDHELNGVANYTRGWAGAGRKSVVCTMQTNNTSDRVDIAIPDQTWTALGTGATIAGAVLIKEGASNDTTSQLIAYFGLTPTPTNGGDVTLNFADLGSGGNLQLAVQVA